MDTAKIFWSGRSQAVWLPKDFRFDAKTVRIRRHGNAVILEPVTEDGTWLDAVTGKFDEDFVSGASEQPSNKRVQPSTGCLNLKTAVDCFPT